MLSHSLGIFGLWSYHLLPTFLLRLAPLHVSEFSCFGKPALEAEHSLCPDTLLTPTSLTCACLKFQCSGTAWVHTGGCTPVRWIPMGAPLPRLSPILTCEKRGDPHLGVHRCRCRRGPRGSELHSVIWRLHLLRLAGFNIVKTSKPIAQRSPQKDRSPSLGIRHSRPAKSESSTA